MPINVIQLQTGLLEFAKLLVNFGAQLFAQRALKEITEPCARWIVCELLFSVNQKRNIFRRQSRATTEKGQVQTDSQTGILARQQYRLGAGGFVHHQAGGGQDALTMGPDDCLVYRRGKTKVVSIDDEPSPSIRRHSWGIKLTRQSDTTRA